MRTGRLPPRTWIVPHDLRADELAGSAASSDTASTTASTAFLWATPTPLIGAWRAEPWREPRSRVQTSRGVNVCERYPQTERMKRHPPLSHRPRKQRVWPSQYAQASYDIPATRRAIRPGRGIVTLRAPHPGGQLHHRHPFNASERSGPRAPAQQCGGSRFRAWGDPRGARPMSTRARPGGGKVRWRNRAGRDDDPAAGWGGRPPSARPERETPRAADAASHGHVWFCAMRLRLPVLAAVGMMLAGVPAGAGARAVRHCVTGPNPAGAQLDVSGASCAGARRVESAVFSRCGDRTTCLVSGFRCVSGGPHFSRRPGPFQVSHHGFCRTRRRTIEFDAT